MVVSVAILFCLVISIPVSTSEESSVPPPKDYCEHLSGSNWYIMHGIPPAVKACFDSADNKARECIQEATDKMRADVAKLAEPDKSELTACFESLRPFGLQLGPMNCKQQTFVKDCMEGLPLSITPVEPLSTLQATEVQAFVENQIANYENQVCWQEAVNSKKECRQRALAASPKYK